ncbi:ABC transporter substrate-binding protein [Noviherbaspirillum sp.]|jgi:branched-chain amino acid transport system substrate-binding protein|uniref:ABC transporter substrate-binding protein n=1 Tax=Noviherbaspirillum sp. TaxID=1926288 RepID=UPI0025FA0605|nr:ABC transporter substrate-binding protein [Noviherbaspirillum sp.]
MKAVSKLAAVLVGLSLVQGHALAQASGDLVIGYSMAKTGPYVSLAIGNEIAADLAVEEINARGGINGKKIKLSKFDTGGDPKSAVTAVRRFAQDEKALAVIGPFSSSECRVAFPAGESAGLVQTSMGSSAPGLTAGFSYGFRNTVDEGIVIEEVMETLSSKKIPSSNVAIAYGTDDAVSKSIGTAVLPAVFGKAKSNVKQTVDFKVKAFDLSPQVSQLVQSQPDVIGVGAPPELAVKLAVELHRQGFKGRMIGGTTIADPDLPKRMAPGGEGMTIGTTYHANAGVKSKEFAAAYEKRAKAAGLSRTEPNQMDAATYDIVLMYAAAMANAKVSGDAANLAKDRTAIRDYLSTMTNLKGVEGDISFNKDRDAIKPVYVVEAKGGAWSLVATRKSK